MKITPLPRLLRLRRRRHATLIVVALAIFGAVAAALSPRAAAGIAVGAAVLAALVPLAVDSHRADQDPIHRPTAPRAPHSTTDT